MSLKDDIDQYWNSTVVNQYVDLAEARLADQKAKNEADINQLASKKQAEIDSTITAFNTSQREISESYLQSVHNSDPISPPVVIDSKSTNYWPWMIGILAYYFLRKGF